MKFIFSYIKKYRKMFFTAVLFLTIETMADLLQPTLMSYIVDNGVQQKDVKQILIYGVIMLFIAAMGAMGAVVRNIFASKTSQLISMEMRSDIYKKVLDLSFENIDRLAPSSIITRITNDVTQIQNFINGTMRIMLKAPITCIGAISLIILRTPQQIPMMIVILCISFCLIGANMWFGYPRFGKVQRCLDKLNDVSREFLTSIRVVKAFGGQEQEEEKFGRAAGEFAKAGISATRVSAVFSPLINLTVNAGIVVLLWLSQNQNSGEIGRLMASVNYMTQVLFSLGMVSMILNTAVRAVASAGRVEEVMNEVAAQKDGVKTDTATSAQADGATYTSAQADSSRRGAKVCFENVTFSYAGEGEPAIEEVSFVANPGETIGIIGPTGCGKSSLVNLVPRFYDAQEGRILINDIEVKEWSMDALRKKIGVAPQKALLFTGSIVENLRWGAEDATMEEIREAAKIACADEFVTGFEKGYESLLGQSGVNISGGQKQRLSLARALLKKPEILILDDCTSALDATTEAAVLEGLRQKAAEMTVLLISQRISTVMRADKILCLEDGKVEGFGTHQELMDSCDTYRAIYASQIGGGQIG
ncbi:MAG: ABC transporter ATP-binding protein [Lachnospiraceae bacterium]|nr:ABC transporter ATP-binding protein [Lachnospiraceae bacterium]